MRQVTQIMATLTQFTSRYGARESPVILLGDLNARHFGEIRGIARTARGLKEWRWLSVAVLGSRC